MPDEAPPPKQGTPQIDSATRRRGSAAIAIVAMCGLTSSWEGERLHPYVDRLAKGHPMTVCRGDTHIAMHVYTHAQCQLVLQGEAERIWLPAVKRVMPHIDQDPYMWAAYADFAYNAGAGRLARSHIPDLYNSGHKVAACHEMEKYKIANHRLVPGLYHRRVGDQWRIGEVQLCLMPFPKS